MKKKTIIYLLLLILIISNTPPAQFFLQENYTYRNLEGTFHYSEEGGKGMSFEGCLDRYYDFIMNNPHQKDLTLYRTFTIKPWRFWEWYQMLFHNQRFRLPYLEPEKPA